MSAPKASGERGAQRQYGLDAARRNARRSPERRRAAERQRQYVETDPAKQPDTADQAAARALWQADETPGLDESHAIAGHPNYTPRRRT